MKAETRRFAAMIRYAEATEPGVLCSRALSQLLDALKFFLPLLLSKTVIESIADGREPVQILYTVIPAVTAFFLLGAASGILARRAEYHQQRFYKKHQLNKAARSLDLGYEHTESSDIQSEIAALKQLEIAAVVGLRAFQTQFAMFAGASVGVIVSGWIAVSLFVSRTLQSGGLIDFLAAAGFAAAVLILHLAAARIDARIYQKFGSYVSENFRRESRYLKTYGHLVYDYHTAKDIRLYSRDLADSYTDKTLAINRNVYNHLFRIFSIGTTIRELVDALIISSTLLFVGICAMRGTLRPSEIFLSIGILQLLFLHVAQLVEAVSVFRSSDSFRERTLRFLGEKPAPSSSEDAETNRTDRVRELPSPASVELHGVRFRYPGTDRDVLRGVDLTLRSGEKLALVGLNGSGKTTLIKLILGLYRPTEGEIHIDGIPAETLGEGEYARRFSVVFQDFRLLSLSLGENVAAAPDYDAGRVLECMNAVGMGDFCQRHDATDYLYRSFESDGIEISGGEAQKIAMARAIYHGGEIYILDEPTAALDPIAESEIYTHFDRITSGGTAIYISHRLSSCKFCDRIAVLENGVIVQLGTHDELLNDSSGTYRTLWDAQAKHYREAGHRAAEAAGSGEAPVML